MNFKVNTLKTQHTFFAIRLQLLNQGPFSMNTVSVINMSRSRFGICRNTSMVIHVHGDL